MNKQNMSLFPWTTLGTLPTLYLTLKTNISYWHYQPHFTGRETESKRLSVLPQATEKQVIKIPIQSDLTA